MGRPCCIANCLHVGSSKWADFFFAFAVAFTLRLILGYTVSAETESMRLPLDRDCRVHAEIQRDHQYLTCEARMNLGFLFAFSS